MRSMRLVPRVALALFATSVGAACNPTAQSAPESDWPMYRGNPAGTGYSALDQIGPDNVGSLASGWTYSLRGNPAMEPNSQVTPIVVEDLMYLPAVDRIVALDPTTGEEVWRHAVTEGAPSRRGVSYWPGASEIPARVIFTAGSRLVALDAATGALAEEFGVSGVVDMVIPYNSVPLVHANVVVVGANTPTGTIGGIGNARAFDARTGAKLWEFSSVAQPGDAGHDTWEGESWRGRLGGNAWPFYFTVDVQRGLVYLPLAAPIPFWSGGDRVGDNLFANSVVAVEIETGEYVWHFQTIHHDLWDHDPPAPPVLFDFPLGGETVPALGLTTKSGYLYLLNRETGEPLFGIEERLMPQSDVPGEVTSPTQPIPTYSGGTLARVSYTPSDLATAEDTSSEHVRACSELIESVGEIYHAGPFTPWVYRGPGSRARTTLLFPGLVGGPNWGGVSFDPATQYLIAFSQDIGALVWLEDAASDFPVAYARSGPRPTSFDVAMGEQRWPCQKPPWGQLTAVDATTGEIAWQRPLGISEGLPEAKAETGRPGRAAAIVTGSGLVFVASTDDNYFRALSTATGEILWETRMERRGNANPMTYLGADGRQYVVVTATEEVIAFRLP